MLRLLTPIVLAVLIAPVRAADAPSAAAPVSAPAAATPCECGGPGKCCGGQTMAPVTPSDKPAGERSCGCGAAKRKARSTTK